MSRSPKGPHHSKNLLLSTANPDWVDVWNDIGVTTYDVADKSWDVLDLSQETIVDGDNVWESLTDTFFDVSTKGSVEIPDNMESIKGFQNFYVEETESWFWVVKLVNWEFKDLTHKSHPEPLRFNKSWAAVTRYNQWIKFSQIHDDKVTYCISDDQLSQIEQSKWVQDKNVFVLKRKDKRWIVLFCNDKLIDLTEFWFDYIEWMKQEWYFLVKKDNKIAFAKLDNNSVKYTKFKRGGVDKKRVTDFNGYENIYRLGWVWRHLSLEDHFKRK